jgi:hypothetical protein
MHSPRHTICRHQGGAATWEERPRVYTIGANHTAQRACCLRLSNDTLNPATSGMHRSHLSVGAVGNLDPFVRRLWVS